MPRMTIEFNDKVDRILKEISEEEQTTKADVIRRALALYDLIHEEVVSKQRKLVIKDKDDGKETEVLLW